MPLFDLRHKTALITGASSGLGWRMAETLAQAGARVILTARRKERLDELAAAITAQGGEALAVAMDVTDRPMVRAVLDEITPRETIDILVNNAGIAPKTPLFDSSSDEVVESLFATNVLGLWTVTQKIATHMRAQKIAGSIINIASVNGANKVRAEGAGYAATKAAVIQLTKVLVGELSPHAIRINAILPGLFLTPLTEPRLRDDATRLAAQRSIPLGFIAEPKDLDGLILYLASNEASRYVTGSAFTIDGGISWGGVH